jgi:acyl transferase domain-containing protein
MLVLKKLSDAERDGDHIYGVIRGTAENHSGRSSSLSAPNPKAQADLLITAYRKAGIDPRTVGYIEAHATGTPLGDPIEINGLKAAWSLLAQTRGEGPLPQGTCGIGSLKSNIGHLELASGVAGVIKVLLQMQHKRLIKSLHCEQVNPYIQLEGSPFYIVQESREWEAQRDRMGNILPRRAGVSAFGLGGVNAHVVLEEYVPGSQRKNRGDGVFPPALIVLSAKNEERLREQVRQLLIWIQTEVSHSRGDVMVGVGGDEVPCVGRGPCVAPVPSDTPNLQDLAYTLQVGREAMEERLALQVRSLAELEEKLGSYLSASVQEGGDWYRGQVKQYKETVALLNIEEELQEAIGKWQKQGKYEKLLQWWVKGGPIDWRHLYGEHLPRRISLPTYPFACERYWLPIPKSD